MRSPVINIFKKKHPEAGKVAAETAGPASKAHRSDGFFNGMPSFWVGLMACGLAWFFCYGCHKFFIWFPPYLKEIFLNLKGLPPAWADLGDYWAEKGLTWIAIAAAVYHILWLLSTRYKLTSHDIHIESWFPYRKVTTIPFGAVRRIGFQQSILGLIFNYGHVEIDTGSLSDPLVLLNCPRPGKFVGLLQPKVESILQPHTTPHSRSSDLH